ncbi:MAG TPA: peroxiredoxin family protein [Bacteroidia bacterium]|nr:peroxiredoxin family protein [Bacteroidia bacterium]
MRKHDIVTSLLILVALAGAGLYYYSGVPLAGQVIFILALFGSIYQTKLIGAVFQSWWVLIACSCAGGIVGDWFLSGTFVLSYLAINLRSFVFTKAVYSRALWVDPLLAVAGLLVYVSVNLLHHNGWQGWTFPAPLILLSLNVSFVGYADRTRVEKMLEMGVIETGATAPDFSLANYNGEKISLSDYKDKRDVLLIFVRGDWCPGCHIMLRLYERERKKFQDKNIMLFAIGPDPIGVNKAMVEKMGVEFAVLSDENLEVSKKYCVRIQEDSPAHKADPGIPLPASFLIDKKGIIRYTSRANNAGEFLRPDIIFDVLAKI